MWNSLTDLQVLSVKHHPWPPQPPAQRPMKTVYNNPNFSNSLEHHKTHTHTDKLFAWCLHTKNVSYNENSRNTWRDLPYSKILPVDVLSQINLTNSTQSEFWVDHTKTRMWANAQRDGRPAEYRFRPLFNAAKFGWRPVLQCRAVTLPRRETRWNVLGCPKLANISQPLVGRSSPYCWNMWRRYCCLTSFFSDCR